MASIDAAAIEIKVASPFMMHLCSISGYGLNLLPSINNNSGCMLSLLIALCILKNDAFKILILSISLALTIPIDQARAAFLMIGKRDSLCFSDSFLLSFNSEFLNVLGRIIAAATTTWIGADPPDRPLAGRRPVVG